MTERVLIHGVDTFMGRHLTAALTRSGWANPVGVVAADARALREALPLARVIIHCSVGGAGTVRRSADLLYGALKARGEAPRVVHIGSMAVYGLVAGVVDEDSPTPADAGSYASAQLAAEMHQTEHSGVVILRSGVEIGPDCPHWSGRIARLLVERRLGDIGAAGDGICNLTYIEDLANVALTAARQPGIDGEIFNIASSAKLTWNDYFIEFARALGDESGQKDHTSTPRVGEQAFRIAADTRRNRRSQARIERDLNPAVDNSLAPDLLRAGNVPERRKGGAQVGSEMDPLGGGTSDHRGVLSITWCFLLVRSKYVVCPDQVDAKYRRVEVGADVVGTARLNACVGSNRQPSQHLIIEFESSEL